jgi:bifunctional UDP-N-acetylglucosamine pyrophosphorylase / glucosamine-1-phosphate N-acetyltransferase
MSTQRAAAQPPLSVIILAAGQGTRMQSDLPKVLQPLAGRPLLQHVIEIASSLEPAAIHVVYGFGADRVREALANQPVSWVLQEQQLGTGHAVMQAMPHIPNDHLVLVLYGDVPLVRAETLRELIESTDSTRVAVLSAYLLDPSGYGRVVRDKRGGVKQIVEQKDATKSQLKLRECNTGMMAAPAKLLRRWLSKLNNRNAQGEYYLTDIVAAAVKEKIRVVPLVADDADETLGINDRAQLAEVEGILRRRRARELLVAGVTLADPDRIDVRGRVETGRDVRLDVNVVLEGQVKLGDRVSIGPNCVIRDTVIEADTQVLANCVIDRASIGPDCSVGPFTRIRPGARLERAVHLGNFVEVKNSTLGEGTKSNHLTYLGDSVVGKGVNVGAGTVTCNYDGLNKFQTRIDDGAFIGSGSMLVAPVSVGANAVIGAGSTITRDAPEGKLTVARSRQLTVDGWKRPDKKKPAAAKVKPSGVGD